MREGRRPVREDEEQEKELWVEEKRKSAWDIFAHAASSP